MILALLFILLTNTPPSETHTHKYIIFYLRILEREREKEMHDRVFHIRYWQMEVLANSWLHTHTHTNTHTHTHRHTHIHTHTHTHTRHTLTPQWAHCIFSEPSGMRIHETLYEFSPVSPVFWEASPLVCSLI